MRFFSTLSSIIFLPSYDSDGGGGGERVLWITIYGLLTQRKHSKGLSVRVYSGEKKSKELILSNVHKRFGIQFDEETRSSIYIVQLKSRFLLEAKYYPVATMIFQSLFSIIVGFECFLNHIPDIFCDTTGAAFIYPLFSILAQSKVIAYVHYPIISTDMLQLVREQRPSYNNHGVIASSLSISKLKLYYYHGFVMMYSMVGSFADVVIANSTWTAQHISNIWKKNYESIDDTHTTTSSNSVIRSNNIRIIYPPCDTSPSKPSLLLEKTSNFIQYLQTECHDKCVLLSIGQFRPEKNHSLQIRTLANFKRAHNSNGLTSERLKRKDGVVLILAGSVRHFDDELLLHQLCVEAIQLGLIIGGDNFDLQLENELFQQYPNQFVSFNDPTSLTHHGRTVDVCFAINQTYDHLNCLMKLSMIGLHSMWNEHFGISIVDMMAAGLMVIAHNSGGPKLDIIHTTDHGRTGFLASDVIEYTECIHTILSELSEEELIQIQQNAQNSVVNKFSNEVFLCKMIPIFNELIKTIE